jgi:uncharacterized protein with FMN-binding domain
MKRVLLALFGTIGGLIALLDFKSQAPIQVTGLSASAPAPASSTSPTTSTGAPASSPTGAASTGTSARTITGSAVTTRYGTVQVQVVVSGTAIQSVTFAQLTSRDGRSAQINSEAGPILLRETISAQSAQVDTVSGATYTSDGYRQSLQSALDQVGK